MKWYQGKNMNLYSSLLDFKKVLKRQKKRKKLGVDDNEEVRYQSLMSLLEMSEKTQAVAQAGPFQSLSTLAMYLQTKKTKILNR